MWILPLFFGENLEQNLAALTGGIHYKQGKAWIQINGQWIRVPMYDKESKTEATSFEVPLD